ncbi:MAG: YkoF family thiamine/hydroxymethylpyrimidine-binding protein [Gammaproteobacteria bacterium]|jgi:uncharacterized protein YqgV (UPF0045/DUF77 family)
MQISVELSCYPLAEKYIPPIKAFIDKINQTEGVTALTNTMSTQLFGDSAVLFPLLEQAMTSSWQEEGKAVFVCKFINGDLSPK